MAGPDFEARERLAEALQPLVGDNKMRAYARSLQVSSTTVAKWLECESFPSGKNVAKVARSLGMSLDEFSRKIIEGNDSGSFEPVDQAISIIRSLPPADLSKVLMVIAELVQSHRQGEAVRPPERLENGVKT